MNLVAGSVVEIPAKSSQTSIAAVLSTASGKTRLYLLNGKETTIPDKKILHATQRPVVSVADRENCRTTLGQIDQIRSDTAAKICLSELHELLVDDPRGYSLTELAEFLFSADDENSIAALLRALSADGLYFKYKNDQYFPVSSEDLAQAQEQLQKKLAREEEEAHKTAAFKEAASSRQFPEILREHLADLRLYVAAGDESNIPGRLTNILDKAGLANPRKLFSLMVSCGEMDEDENLLLIKNRVPVDFSEEIISEALNLRSTHIDTGNRRDLTGQKTWAIDTPGSKDRDDAFSFVEQTDGSKLLFIHIADPSEYIKPGSLIDSEAQKRGSSIYMPDKRIHMLPPQLSEEFLSLESGVDHLAVTIQMHFDESANLINTEIFESVIKIEQATFYDKANSELEKNEWLKNAYEFSQALTNKRKLQGAAMFPRQGELSVEIINGEIVVSQRSRDELTQGMIAEFMIWANHATALWFHEREIPCLYRTQEGPDSWPDFGETFDPVTFFPALRSFRKTSISNKASRHASLGLDAYVQVTSPLRRYSDMLLQRQIKAFLNNQTLPYDATELAHNMCIADETVGCADFIMREREKYYVLKYLKQQQKDSEVLLDAVVVDTSGSDAIFYCDFLCGFKHCRKPAFDIVVGQKLKARVNKIDLFDGIIRFDLRP